VLAPCFPSNIKALPLWGTKYFIATVESIIKNELIGAIEATVGSRLLPLKNGAEDVKREKLRDCFEESIRGVSIA